MMIPAKQQTECRQGFTLVELLIVMMIIGLLASMVLVALAGAQESARVARTRAQIARIDMLLQDRWESYHTRRTKSRRTNRSSQSNRDVLARTRLLAIREMMRMEMPDRMTDISSGGSIAPAVWKKYRRMVASATGGSVPGTSYQGAECLYMILKTIRDGDTTALEFFRDSEIGDVDDDGLPEILDGWGRPILFLRWAPGFFSPRQDRDPDNSPDPFDPFQVDFDPLDGERKPQTYALYPLVISAGPDGSYDIVTEVSGGAFRYQPISNDPYAVLNSGLQMGGYADTDNDGKDGSIDNLHSHLMETGIRQ